MIKKTATDTMLTAVVATLAAAPALADSHYSRVQDYGHMWGGGFWFIGAGMMVLFWAVIIFLVVMAVRWLSDGKNARSRPVASALDILQERLARGEIEPEEYETRRKGDCPIFCV